MAHPLTTRRQAVLGALAIPLCCYSNVRRSYAAAANPTAPFNPIAPGVYVRRGIDEDATAANDDAIANIGFIVGRESVAVVDPGGSLQDGERLRARIREVTRLPIRYVVMTHGHPDHIFGAGAFLRDNPQFVGHHRLPQTLAARGEYYRQTLERTLGVGRAGTVISPTQLVQERLDLNLGDRTLRLQAFPPAHSDCDLTVFDSRTATLLTGDLLFVGRVPSLDGRLRGWLAALEVLKAVKASRAVPGHGPAGVDWASGARDLERYLNVLLAQTRQAIARGVQIDAAVTSVAQSERDRWKLFDAYHGHNVTQAFKELEWE